MHLHTTADLLKAGPTGDVRSRLSRNRGPAATLAGRLLFFDLHDPMAARGYYNRSLEAAREAADHQFTAAALGRPSFLPAGEGNFVAAKDYLDGAQRHAHAAGSLLM